MKIDSIKALEILDSRGEPTVEVVVSTKKAQGRAAVPSGASKGKYEAWERRDGDSKRFMGKGVSSVVELINTEIAAAVVGEDVTQQEKIDRILIELDGTSNKARLGANAILGVSLAVCHAAANSLGIPVYEYLGSDWRLPVPLMNILNGGVHADNNLQIQEFMIVPVGFDNFGDALRAGVEIYHSLKKYLKDRGYSVNVGDEGGFAPAMDSTEQALQAIISSIEASNYKVADEVFLGLDVAATQLYDQGYYEIDSDKFSEDELISYYERLVEKYPIITIEDGIVEESWYGWRKLTQRLGHIQLVGDDIFVTNKSRLERAISEGVANAILVKPNQIGTLTEVREVVEVAKAAGYTPVLSHRSGETEDSLLAQLCVGLGCPQIKCGAPARGERTCKYNQLLRIQQTHKEFWAKAAFKCLSC